MGTPITMLSVGPPVSLDWWKCSTNKPITRTPDVSFCLLYCDITFQRPTLPQTKVTLLDSFGRDFERLKSMSKNRLACGDATARWRCKCAYRMPSVRGVTLKSIEAGPAQFRAKYDWNTMGKDTKSPLQRSGWQVTAWQHDQSRNLNWDLILQKR